MDPVNKQASPSPRQNQPHTDNVGAASAGGSYYGRKTAVLKSARALFNKFIIWIAKPLKARKIRVHFAKNSVLSTTGFNNNCTKLLLAIMDGKNRQLPKLLDKLRLSIPAAIPHKSKHKIESSDIIGLFENWSAQCTNHEFAESLRKDLLNPESNIRKIWTSQQALSAEVRDFSHQTFQRLNAIEALIGQLATALFPEQIIELMQDVRSHENKIKSSRFFQRFHSIVAKSSS